MSRNFELLAQLEEDLSVASKDAQPQEEDAAASEVERKLRPAYAGHSELLHLVRRIFLPVKGEGLHRVLFCGAADEFCSSIVCAEVARALAGQTYKKVCVVDANLMRRGVSALMEGSNATRTQSANGVGYEQVQLEPNLYLIRSEALTAPGVSTFAGDQLGAIFAQLEKEFEFIVIDGPSPMASDHCILLGQLSDAAVLVVEAGKTRRTMAAEAVAILSHAGVEVAGAVMHNHILPVPERIYRHL